MWSGPSGAIAVALMDGATGCGFGALAAEEIQRALPALLDPADACAGRWNPDVLVAELDSRVDALERDCDATLALAAFDGGTLTVLAVGDSHVLFVPDEGPHRVLTFQARARPRIGGGCWPPFVRSEADLPPGWVCLVCDGVHEPMGWKAVAESVRVHGAGAPAEMEKAIRAPRAGGLPDDFSAVVFRTDAEASEISASDGFSEGV